MNVGNIEIGGEEADQVRSVNEIVNRAMALGAVVAVSFGVPREEILPWLKEEFLQSELTDREYRFLFEIDDLEKEEIYYTWMSERLIVLLWSLQFSKKLPAINEECDTKVLEVTLPPYGDYTVTAFRDAAQLRSEDELLDMACKVQEFHAKAISNERRGINLGEINLEIIQERHTAINWVVGYGGLAWDLVTADT